MNKKEFLTQLRKGLSGLPEEDREERLTFYNEIIDDRMEEGLTEEEAVFQTGSVDEIIAQTIAETPLTRIARERLRPKRRLKVWEIILIILGFPVWLPLFFAGVLLILSVFMVLWSIIAALGAFVISLGLCFVAGIVQAVSLFMQGNGVAGFALLAAGVACMGISIFLFYGFRIAARGIMMLSRRLWIGIKNCFMEKEEK